MYREGEMTGNHAEFRYERCHCDTCKAIREMTRPEKIPGLNLLSKLSLECYEEGNMTGVYILSNAMIFLINNDLEQNLKPKRRNTAEGFSHRDQLQVRSTVDKVIYGPDCKCESV
jgi:hypothetical protein